MAITIHYLVSSILFYNHVFNIVLHQGKGVMNTYWLLGKEGSFLSSCKEDFLLLEKTPDFLEIISEAQKKEYKSP
jgi:hypothetical protein